MKVVKNWPPNIGEIRVRFGSSITNQALFAYGDTIYSPSTKNIPDYLIVHEEVHERQQKEFGGPEAWWKKYLSSNEFMLEQEVEAYHEQYKFYCARESDWSLRYKMLLSCATALSSPVYGSSIGKAHALFRIRYGK